MTESEEEASNEGYERGREQGEAIGRQSASSPSSGRSSSGGGGGGYSGPTYDAASHGVVTACMVGLFIMVVFYNGWNIKVKNWLDNAINTKSPLASK